MKKFLIMGVLLLVILLSAGQASAWHRPAHHRHFGFGIIIGPPIILPPPPPIYYRDYYPPYGYYGPGYYGPPGYYDYGRRVWIPGHWEDRWTPYGWDRVWIPGYWEYSP